MSFRYRQTLASGSVISAAGNYDLGSGSAIGSLTPKVRFNAGINYSIAGFNAGIRGRYIGGFDECAGSDGASDSSGLCSLPVDSSGNPVATSPYPAHHVPAYVTFDLLLSHMYRNPFGNTTLAVGMRNVFDKAPPYVYDETSSSPTRATTWWAASSTAASCKPSDSTALRLCLDLPCGCCVELRALAPDDTPGLD